MGGIIPLHEVDEVGITIVMDNVIDVLMAGTPVAHRYALPSDAFDHPQPLAQHGFSVLLNVKRGEKRGTLLFDTGVSPEGLLHNIDVMQIKLADVQGIVLSHGHPDHALGLPGVVDRLGKRNLPLVLHPDAYLERKLQLPNGVEVMVPPPRKADFQRENIDVIEEVGPSMLVDGMVLVSGEVARTTEFEKGLPYHLAKRDGVWENDPWIHDDQCAIMNVRGKGLVIVTGCGHAGIINIVRNAQRLTGVEQIHAIVGGFHLTGGLFEPIIPATVDALLKLNPRYLVPGHCTGLSATMQLARAMPDAFIPNSVGTTFQL